MLKCQWWLKYKMQPQNLHCHIEDYLFWCNICNYERQLSPNPLPSLTLRGLKGNSLFSPLQLIICRFNWTSKWTAINEFPSLHCFEFYATNYFPQCRNALHNAMDHCHNSWKLLSTVASVSILDSHCTFICSESNKTENEIVSKVKVSSKCKK